MEESNRKITVEIEDRRAEGDPLTNDARHFASVLTKKGLTVDALGSEEAPLRREGDNRDAMVAAVRKEYARAANFTVTKNPDEVVEEPLAPANNGALERLTDVERACLEAMKVDFKRGIVVIDEDAGVEAYQSTLETSRTAGTTWEVVQARLLVNEGALLKKAATMQGKGELIGVFKGGELCIIDRADRDGNREPVITAFDAENNRIVITSDTPDRVNAMGAITGNGGKFADYWEIRRAVREDGFTLPPDSPKYEKKGIVAAAEALSGKPFVRSENGKDWRSAILECGDVSRDAPVRVVHFYPDRGYAFVRYAYPGDRSGRRGAVRVLRG